MRRDWATGILLIAVFALHGDAGAQENPTIASLQVRVRLSTLRGAGEPQLVGSLVRLTRDTVVIVHEARQTEIAVPLSALRKFERSEGRHSNAGKGTLWGLVTGSVVGAGFGIALCAGERCTGEAGPIVGFFSLVSGVGIALAGLGVGALVGSLIHTERWRELPLPELRSGVAPR